MDARPNRAFELRTEVARRLLGKDEEEVKKDEETGEEVRVKKKPEKKTISKEDALALEYKALVSEGATLYHAKEYRRAIEAFTQAMDKQKEDQSILVQRANCYIQVGQPEDALRDVDVVLRDSPTNPHAIRTKAEAYFSMGEFEFALVFFQRGRAIRQDIVAFRDGITKCRSAILDSINGVDLFEANPNYAASRPRKPLPVPAVADEEAERPEDPEKLRRTAALLPEKVEPLVTGKGQKENLGELSLDYDYLLELRAEVKEGTEDESSGKEDEEIRGIVDDALMYLEQRSAFWCQQGGGSGGAEAAPNQRQANAAEAGKKRPRPVAASQRAPHYELSKIQQYEAKYGTVPRRSESRKKDEEQPAEAGD
jgi:tetratricopeptide (TPR) repeat protein